MSWGFEQAMTHPNIQSARETKDAVHDQYFSVGAQVHRQEPAYAEQRQEPGMTHAVLAESVQDGWPGVTGAGGVDQDTHFDAAASGLAQRVREGDSDFVA